MLHPLTSLVLIFSRIATGVAVLRTVSLKPAIALFVRLDNSVAAERLTAVLETIVFAVQLVHHRI